MKSSTAAGFVIFRRISSNIQYLLLQASYGDHHWTPPKGFVEDGETNELETAFRETQEESGLDKNDLKIYEVAKKVLKYNVRGKPKTVIYWLAEIINPNATVRLSDEHQDFKWLDLEEACTLGKYQEMTELLKFCDEFIKQNIS